MDSKADRSVKLSRDDAKRRIHDAGLRATSPRVAVLQFLASADKPLSHAAVVDAMGSDDWDPATLYRNLVKLVEVDLALVASQVGGIARYAIRGDRDDPHRHPHFSCRICGSVACLPGAKLTGSVGTGWQRSLATSEVQLVGECPDCLGTA